MPKAVRIETWGSLDDLTTVEIESPEPGAGEVRVRVRATGLNPVDWKIIEIPQVRAFYAQGLELPAGNGNDFAGEIDAIGEGVTEWKVGDAVLGGRRFFAQADQVVVAADKLVRIPEGLSWEQAGGLDIVGRTAVASVRAVAPQPGETVLVSAAAGGVGILAAQLVKLAGARVIGTASEANHDFLRELGIEPVAYGDGLADRVRALAPDGVDAVLDNEGATTLRLAVELGVPIGRVNTIADRATAGEIGASGVGGADADLDDLAGLAAQIAAGDVVSPIDSTYPLDRVRDAYARLKGGHLRGKVVLVTE